MPPASPAASMPHDVAPDLEPSDPGASHDAPAPTPIERHARLAARALAVPYAIALRDAARHPQAGAVGVPEWIFVGGDPFARLAAGRPRPAAGEHVAIRDLREDPGFDGDPDGREPGEPAEPVAFACVPLLDPAGHAEGYLAVADQHPRDWTEAELRLLADVASTADAETHARAELAERVALEEHLRHNTLHDALTALPNRTLFTERLTHVITRARRHPDFLFTVLFLDLDRFKVVNDSLGHHVGDELLVAVAHRLKRCLREVDTVARLGGDEFAILLEGVHGEDDAVRVAERIHAEFSSAINLSGFEVFTSMSIGIVLSSSAHELPAYLLRSADMAMYNAKAAGRARYAMFDRTMHAQALFRLQLDTDLRRAVERGEFYLHYQPVVNLATGRLAGFEALIRWSHPERGFVSPGEFIPIAEETGLVVPMGRWVLREACRQLREWQDRYPAAAELFVSVNISARQFAQSGLVEQVAYILREMRLDPSCLKLEITESSVVENTQQAAAVLRELKAQGVEIYMDDFGTGYSSLSYLHRLPLDALKIDRSFVRDVATQQRQSEFVATILMLARTVRLRAVAEGVERPDQLAELRRLGCEFAQGYLFSPPADPATAAEFIAAGKHW